MHDGSLEVCKGSKAKDKVQDFLQITESFTGFVMPFLVTEQRNVIADLERRLAETEELVANLALVDQLTKMYEMLAGRLYYALAGFFRGSPRHFYRIISKLPMSTYPLIRNEILDKIEELARVTERKPIHLKDAAQLHGSIYKLICDLEERISQKKRFK